jgi:hypothetical protein
MKWLVRVSGNTKNSKINMEVKYMDDLKLNNIYQKIAYTIIETIPEEWSMLVAIRKCTVWQLSVCIYFCIIIT